MGECRSGSERLVAQVRRASVQVTERSAEERSSSGVAGAVEGELDGVGGEREVVEGMGGERTERVQVRVFVGMGVGGRGVLAWRRRRRVGSLEVGGRVVGAWMKVRRCPAKRGGWERVEM